jgi:hypothetical protein
VYIYYRCKYGHWSKFAPVRLSVKVSPTEWLPRMLHRVEGLEVHPNSEIVIALSIITMAATVRF